MCVSSDLSLVTGGGLPPVSSSRPHTASSIIPTQTTAQQPWPGSVLPWNAADSVGVDALARRFGHPDVTHITGTVLPQAGTPLGAPR